MKTKLNRYVRYIYRKMMIPYGKEKVREEALRIYILTTREKKRILEEHDSFFSDEFKDGVMVLLKEWRINPKFINESICVFDTEENLIQTLKDLTPLRVRIRKLTPRECGRLMGCTDKDIDLMESAGISNSGRYKLFGNSIVVPVLEGIFSQMFRVDDDCLF